LVWINYGKPIWFVGFVEERRILVLAMMSEERLEERSAYLAYETWWLKPDGYLSLIEDMAIEVEET
jgi:hypothetical protein